MDIKNETYERFPERSFGTSHGAHRGLGQALAIPRREFKKTLSGSKENVMRGMSLGVYKLNLALRKALEEDPAIKNMTHFCLIFVECFSLPDTDQIICKLDMTLEISEFFDFTLRLNDIKRDIERILTATARIVGREVDLESFPFQDLPDGPFFRKKENFSLEKIKLQVDVSFCQNHHHGLQPEVAVCGIHKQGSLYCPSDIRYDNLKKLEDQLKE